MVEIMGLDVSQLCCVLFLLNNAIVFDTPRHRMAA